LGKIGFLKFLVGEIGFIKSKEIRFFRIKIGFLKFLVGEIGFFKSQEILFFRKIGFLKFLVGEIGFFKSQEIRFFGKIGFLKLSGIFHSNFSSFDTEKTINFISSASMAICPTC
jgi:hypothetical protein